MKDYCNHLSPNALGKMCLVWFSLAVIKRDQPHYQNYILGLSVMECIAKTYDNIAVVNTNDVSITLCKYVNK